MEEIRESGTTLFYVSHAAASVRRMCDRVLVLEKGRLVYDGPVDEGIRFLHYDDDTSEDPEELAEEESMDEAMGADI
jgi:ABC-2 type transport system ATP-binding protein